MTTRVPFDLERFVQAQHANDTYGAALAELRSGRKVGHWMWFVFPQLAGLGSSSMSRRYAISSVEEARRYLAHPVLRERLEECARALLGLPAASTAVEVLGRVDALKLRSSMTLFARAAPGRSVFRDVLDRCFEGQEDGATVALLEASPFQGTSGGPAHLV